MSAHTDQSARDDLLGSLWRDEHGNTFRIFSIYWTDDPEIRMAYVPPDRKTLTLSELRTSHRALDEEQPDG